MPGQSCKGVYADCVGFVAGVLDEYLGTQSATRFPRQFTSGANLSPLVRYCKEHWGYEEISHSGIVVEGAPGDVLIGRFARHSLHMYIVGTQPNTVWHCLENDGVCVMGSASVTVLKAYKPKGG